MSVMSRTRNRWLALKKTISRLRFDGGAGAKCGAASFPGHCWRAPDAVDSDVLGAAAPCDGPQDTATNTTTARLRTKAARNIVLLAQTRLRTMSYCLAWVDPPHPDPHAGPSGCGCERLAPVPGLLALLARAAWS